MSDTGDGDYNSGQNSRPRQHHQPMRWPSGGRGWSIVAGLALLLILAAFAAS
ncbi:hypothetical protein [Kitasatospora sp. NPDC050543]|uniref:hypothetical protein n=1 Tax=Kitasatospora sp. NPDC050543 TaxID=3364054 RepID=UPI0037B4D9AE